VQIRITKGYGYGLIWTIGISGLCMIGHCGLEVGSTGRALGVSRRALVRAGVHWACSGEAQVRDLVRPATVRTVCGQSQPGTAWV
jgi:hypothetical protein